MAKILLKTKPVRGFAALAAFLLAFGLVFALASCDSNDESGGGGGDDTTQLSGTTWKYDTKVLVFAQQGNGVTRPDDDDIPQGTYSISGSTVTMKFFFITMTGTLTDSTHMTVTGTGASEVFVKQ